MEKDGKTMPKRYSFIVLVAVLISGGSLRAQDPKLTFHGGGGVSAPLNPTGAYAGVSGNVLFGAGYKVSKKGAIVGEFLWSGLPSNVLIIQPVRLPSSNVNLFALNVSYRHEFDRLNGSPFGLYLSGGGGWYYRYVTFDQEYAVTPGTVCLPVYGWWGYTCSPSGYVYEQTIAKKGSSTGGFNTGAGFTIRFSDSNWRFFTEARYHYAFTERVPATLIPITMGLRYN
jgi:hypothetical protein